MNQQQLVNDYVYNIHQPSLNKITIDNTRVILYMDEYLYNNKNYINIVKFYVSNYNVEFIFNIDDINSGTILCTSIERFYDICKEIFDKLYNND